MTDISIDLGSTPFSRRGSYFAVSRLDQSENAGIFLRTVHGDVRQRELMKLSFDGAMPVVRTTGGRLTMTGPAAVAELALDGKRAVLRVLRGSLSLDMQVASRYDVVLQDRPNTWRFIASGANRNYRIVAEAGAAHLVSGWDGLKDSSARLTITAGDTPTTVIIDEFEITAPEITSADIDAIAASADADFDSWLTTHGGATASSELNAATCLAAYVTWSALVPAGGMLRRESMLMSKNGMTHIWSWDHCFNAVALARDADAAFGQLMTLFDHQDAHGGLPDHIDDFRLQPNFVKPPVHGWAVGRLMDHEGLTDDAVAALYRPLERWTNWWFNHRVYGTDGVPSYNHGNDSGWDNSTVFAEGVPVQSPDLLAFLAVQQDVLARMADRQGLGEGEFWRRRSAETVHLLLDHFWRGDRFVARDTLSGRVIEADSLLTLMPIVLGKRLPKEIFDTLVRRLESGGYLTEHGAATEPVISPHYEPDGYWRGPIWAPTTMLLIDGLRDGGRPDLADDLARRFLATCAKSGMAENFDALTGRGLRDGSMTWTASVYLALLPAHTDPDLSV